MHWTAPRINPYYATNAWLLWLTELAPRTFEVPVRDYHRAVLCIGWYA